MRQIFSCILWIILEYQITCSQANNKFNIYQILKPSKISKIKIKPYGLFQVDFSQKHRAISFSKKWLRGKTANLNEKLVYGSIDQHVIVNILIEAKYKFTQPKAEPWSQNDISQHSWMLTKLRLSINQPTLRPACHTWGSCSGLYQACPISL